MRPIVCYACARSHLMFFFYIKFFLFLLQKLPRAVNSHSYQLTSLDSFGRLVAFFLVSFLRLDTCGHGRAACLDLLSIRGHGGFAGLCSRPHLLPHAPSAARYLPLLLGPKALLRVVHLQAPAPQAVRSGCSCLHPHLPCGRSGPRRGRLPPPARQAG